MLKVLVVDDNSDWRQKIKDRLVRINCEAELASNEGEALVQLTQTDFQVAIVDVRLHGDSPEDQSGLSLALAIRSLKPKTQVILLTKYVRADQVVRAVRYHGVIDFIDKSNPNWFDLLQKTLEETQETQQKEKQLGLQDSSDSSKLSISLIQGRPLMARSRGRHVYSISTPEVLQIKKVDYARKTEMAQKDQKNRRFLVADIGDDLYCDIFDKHYDLKGLYLEARTKSKILTLQFETSRELVNLPLEFIRSDQPEEYLVLQHPLSRFVFNAAPRHYAISPQILAVLPKLRILLISSNTLPFIGGVDAEIRELQMFLNTQEFFPVEVDTINTRNATYEAVREKLRNCDYDIVHYAGHGYYQTESPEESSIFFWEDKDKQGEVLQMTAAEITLLLRESKVRFVYLSSCYGATTGIDVERLDDDFLGLADAIVQSGVPSVLGYRWPASDTGAKKLACAFYGSLLKQGSLEIALWQARCELAVNRNDPTWLSPILIHQS
ncbi:MAG: CHAT domain-containing protein [Chloroflexota bacterium]